MKRPAFQFYPADWKSNSKLRRCSEAARGAWMDVLCLLHDSDDYGVIRWPLADIARAAGVPMKLLKELAEKGVLKGGDSGCEPYTYTPRHGRTEGDPVELVARSESPCWYCSRFVRDEHVRQKRGDSTRFGVGNNQEKTSPKPSPKGGFGESKGDGSTSSSSSSTSLEVDIHTARAPISLEKAIAYGREIGCSEEVVRNWHNTRSRDGWLIHGSNGTARPIMSWQNDLATAKSWRSASNGANGTKPNHRRNEYPQEKLELP